jgi:2-polyprenyl-3-methyl-5-hydroxy-6-metoxy-1,4-benzoquinol methylase
MLGHCPACLSTRRQDQRPARGLTLRRCNDCELIYTDPQPRAEVLEKYVVDYNLADHFGAREDRKRVLFHRRLVRLGAPERGRNRLCDLGCADGQFLALAEDHGWQPFGIELNPPAARRARERGATVIEGALEELEELPWGEFDLVTSWDSIEHTPEPRRFIQTAARLLAPGGRLAVSTLNTRSLVARLTGTRWSMIVNDHFTYWHERSLLRLLDVVGLECIDVSYYGLGRDLVRWMDKLPVLGRSAPAIGERGSGASPGKDWSTARPVLALERIVNRLLDATATGVGIEITARDRVGSPR